MRSALVIVAALGVGCGIKGPPRPPETKPPAAEAPRAEGCEQCEACGGAAPTSSTATPAQEAVHPESLDEARDRLRGDAPASARSRGTTPTQDDK
jgi:hypothetical protein